MVGTNEKSSAPQVVAPMVHDDDQTDEFPLISGNLGVAWRGMICLLKKTTGPSP
jgi:hypothetical protein